MKNKYKKGVVLGSLLLFSFLFMLTNSFALELTIRPDSTGLYHDWGNESCPNFVDEWQCVADVVSPENSYVRDALTNKESFGYESSNLTNETINSITVNYFAREQNVQANSCFAPLFRQNGSDTTVTADRICTNSSFEYYTQTYTNNPSTGTSWTVDEIENLEAGMQSDDPNGGGQLAQIFVTIDFTIEDSTPNWQLVCERPVWPYYERSATQDETNLFGHVQMRQYVYPEPTITLLS